MSFSISDTSPDGEPVQTRYIQGAGPQPAQSSLALEQTNLLQPKNLVRVQPPNFLLALSWLKDDAGAINKAVSSAP